MAIMRVNAGDAKNRLPELIKAEKDGQPVVVLVPTKAQAGQKVKFGARRGQIKINDPDWRKAMSDAEVDEFIGDA